ncbi:MAG: hypothetical protein LBS79_03095 [Tannerella sp.]|jgi:hypothetical protein|nr:hypothetical protein [Tannerella sp.]
MNFITEPLVVGIICYFAYMTFELFARRKERMSLIEKMGQNLAPLDSSVLKSQFSSLLPSFPKKSFTGLRMGCLLVGLGLGLFVGLMTCLLINSEIQIHGADQYHNWEKDAFYSVAYGGSLLFFGGLGLIISYIIESKSVKKDEK